MKHLALNSKDGVLISLDVGYSQATRSQIAL
jgi:hypothetical protein